MVRTLRARSKKMAKKLLSDDEDEDYQVDDDVEEDSDDEFRIDENEEPIKRAPTKRRSTRGSKKFKRNIEVLNEDNEINKSFEIPQKKTKKLESFEDEIVDIKSSRSKGKKNKNEKFEEKKKDSNKIKNSKVAKNNHIDEDEDDDSEEDWEEVEDAEMFDIEGYKPDLPDNIKITVKKPKKVKEKGSWVDPWIRLQMNHIRKNIQSNAHKTHLMLYIYRLKFLNSLIKSHEIHALIMSLIDGKFKSRKETESLNQYVKKFSTWFNKTFSWTQSKKLKKNQIDDIKKEVLSNFDSAKIKYQVVLVLIVCSLLRYSGLMVRICYFLYPVPIKPMDLLNKYTKFKKTDEPILVEKVKIDDFSCYWIEVFDDQKKKWHSYDFVNEIFDDSWTIAKRRKLPVAYVISIDNVGSIQDVTLRYAEDWFSYNRIKRRLEGDWWDQTVKLFQRKIISKYEQADQAELEELESKVELPKRRVDYKSHPLFVLQKDVLKFQAIYPIDAPPLGFFQEEPVYSRDCIHFLKSRETWFREALAIKANEEPYKVVNSKIKKVRGFSEPQRGEMELYGKWQTEPYQPPVARNGRVPRNRFNNVDLYKPSMLPIGTVHLKLPGLSRVAAKMKIDCVPAIIGFDTNRQGIGARPIIEGFVVCEEYADILIEAYNKEQGIRTERMKEERLKKIYNNWKKLIKGLLLKRNLMLKYG